MQTLTTKDYAEYFRLALEAGVCHEDEIENWADKMIIETASPIPEWLLNLSIEGDISKNHLLDVVPGKADKISVWRLVLARLGIACRVNQFDREQAIRILYRWAVDRVIPDPFFKQVYHLDDGLDGVAAGWYEESRFIKDVEEFFGQFRAYELLLPGQS